MATFEIQYSLLTAETLGTAVQRINFVNERLVQNQSHCNEKKEMTVSIAEATRLKCYCLIETNNALTMGLLFLVQKSNKEANKTQIERVDTNVLQRLMRAFEACRNAKT
jgi:hypothetical protein